MNSSLSELGTLVADQGANYAHENKNCFLEVLREATGQSVSKMQVHTIFKIFSFLNWAFSNGVWSNLSNTRLRRDLMSQSMQSIVLRTAHEIAEDRSIEGIAFLAANLDSEFKQYALAYTDRMKELAKAGIEPNANTATLCALVWIQESLGLNDEDMDVIVPQFNIRIHDVARIEQIARQVSRAAGARKQGFFSRLFGS